MIDVNDERLLKFAELLEKQQIERLRQLDLACQTNIDNYEVKIKPGKKYIKLVRNISKLMLVIQANIWL